MDTNRTMLTATILHDITLHLLFYVAILYVFIQQMTNTYMNQQLVLNI